MLIGMLRQKKMLLILNERAFSISSSVMENLNM